MWIRKYFLKLFICKETYYNSYKKRIQQSREKNMKPKKYAYLSINLWNIVSLIIYCYWPPEKSILTDVNIILHLIYIYFKSCRKYQIAYMYINVFKNFNRKKSVTLFISLLINTMIVQFRSCAQFWVINEEVYDLHFNL